MKEEFFFQVGVLILLTLLVSCQVHVIEHIESPEVSSQETGSVILGYGQTRQNMTGISSSITGGETNQVLDNVRYMIVSIADAGGKLVVDTKVLTVVNLQGGFISEQLSLETGQYTVEKFMVVDAQHKVLLAAPYKGSPLATKLQQEGKTFQPLPLQFTIQKEQVTSVIPDVADVTAAVTPADFGYTTFGFNIINNDTSGQKIQKIVETRVHSSDNKTETIITKFDLEGKKTVEIRKDFDTNDLWSVYNYNPQGVLFETWEYRAPKDVTPDFNSSHSIIDYQYNEYGQLVNYSYGALRVTYTYDTTGDLIKCNITRSSTNIDMISEYNAKRQLIKYYRSDEENYYIYFYDGNGRKIKERMFRKSDNTLLMTADYIYNAAGNLIKANNHDTYGNYGRCNITYEYDLQGNLVKETARDPNFDSIDLITTYSYQFY